MPRGLAKRSFRATPGKRREIIEAFWKALLPTSPAYRKIDYAAQSAGVARAANESLFGE